jgi:tripartite-type tricarboxylate transporter receptor subunit TctC
MRVLRTLAAGLSLLLLPASVAAQDFPTKPIRLIVPFPAGGPNDTIAISSAGALAISPSMEKVAYDTRKDLQPITLVATVPEMLVVATNVPAKDMNELIALAKAQPGKLNFASSGPGSLPHLAGELLKLTAKIDIVHVPYRGAAPAVNDLLGQQVQMAFLDLPVLLPQVKAGSLRPIVIGSPQRALTAMDVPTTAETGMPDLTVENWYGMVAPAGTPDAIVATLNRIATEAMRDPAVKEKLASQGAELIGDMPEHFRGFIDAEISKWEKVIKDAGVETAQ